MMIRSGAPSMRCSRAMLCRSFPEGRSHSEPGLIELRTGAARIALGAEAQSNWQLGLQIVPAGITYRRKSLFRGQALVRDR